MSRPSNKEEEGDSAHTFAEVGSGEERLTPESDHGSEHRQPESNIADHGDNDSWTDEESDEDLSWVPSRYRSPPLDIPPPRPFILPPPPPPQITHPLTAPLDVSGVIFSKYLRGLENRILSLEKKAEKFKTNPPKPEQLGLKSRIRFKGNRQRGLRKPKQKDVDSDAENEKRSRTIRRYRVEPQVVDYDVHRGYRGRSMSRSISPISSKDVMVERRREMIHLDSDSGVGVSWYKRLQLGRHVVDWTRWRRMKINENKNGRYSSSIGTMGVHVLDVVYDNGDLSLDDTTASTYFPPFGGEMRPEWTQKKWGVIGRVRINSEIIIDSLNEITGANLPTPCIMLHPFKVLVDKEDVIREYYANLLLLDAKMRAGTGKKNKRPKNYTLIHFRELIEFMDEYLTPELDIARVIRQRQTSTIAFCHLWHLFSPGDIILQRNIWDSNPLQLYRVIKVSGGRPKLQSYGYPSDSSPRRYRDRDVDETYKGKRSAFVIDCYYVDFDGTKFRPVHQVLSIQSYEGIRPIDDLEAVPLNLANMEYAKTRMVSDLRRRGQTFLELTKAKAAHREYTGLSLDTEEKVEIDSRIIVDFAGQEVLAAKEIEFPDPDEPDRKIKRLFGVGALSKTDSRELTEFWARYDGDKSMYDDTNYDQERTARQFSDIPILRGQQELAELSAEDDEVLLLPGLVYGFVIRLREFRALDVTLIRDVQLNKSGFDDLVLPTRHRKLIKALVDRHATGSRPVDEGSADADAETKPREPENIDLVRGKGKGLIILLHGAPGTGKTSTAETIADATTRPLLPVTCGDIGETAEEVEKNLARTFSLAHRWGCVLLMDEADVFLSKRRKEDMQRNAVVSVFLRVLEYYSGILFLTTNRVGTIDEAFKSRIHISLYYPPLDWRTTKEIYAVNLRRAAKRVDCDESAILRFAKKHFHNNDGANRWNGRQIFNAFQTAIALAEYDNLGRRKQASVSKTKLTENHFKEVAKTSKKFEEYLQEVHGGEDDAQINLMERIRADFWGLEDMAAPLPSRKQQEVKKKFDSSDMPSTSDGSEDDSSVPQSESDNSGSDRPQKGKKKFRRDDSKERRGKSRRN